MDFPTLRCRYTVHRADSVIVGPEWSKRVFPYPHHRVYYVRGGEAELTLRTGKIHLREGYQYLLPAFSLQEALCPRFLDHRYIHFQALPDLISDPFHLSHGQLSVRVERPNETEAAFDTLERSWTDHSEGGQLAAMGALFSILSGFFKDISAGSNLGKDERLNRVRAYIDDNLNHDLPTERLGEIAGLHPVYLSNLFSRNLGVPLRQYILRRRLEKAQTLLESTDTKIYAIARETGFENEMYFSRLFKSKTGRTPGEYRRLCREMDRGAE